MVDEKDMSYREALNLALDQALAADERVLLLGEDIADPGASGPTKDLSTRYGADRVLDTPISEAGIVGTAVGLAMGGFLPVAEIMIMDFIGIAADQLVNNAAKLRFMTGGRVTAPITVRTQVYGGLGTGATHSQSLEAWFMHIPGLKVIVPATPRDAKGLLTSAIFDEDPCLVLETIRLQGQRGPVPLDPGFSIPLGQAEVKRPGTDVTLVTYGRGLLESLAAAAALESEGVSAEVLDLRTLVPLDLTDFDKIDQMAAAIWQRFGRLDILVGNAGLLGELGPLGHLEPQLFQRLIDLHVTANWRLIRACDAALRQAPAGRALFTSCAAGHEATAYWSGYAVTKAALEMMVRVYAAELGLTRVKAVLVDPGPVATALRKTAFPGEDPAALLRPDDVAQCFLEAALA